MFAEEIYSIQTKKQITYNLITSLSQVWLQKLVNAGPHFDDSKWGSIAGSNKAMSFSWTVAWASLF